MDYEFASFKEAAEEQARLEEKVRNIQAEAKGRVVFADSDIRERRGDNRPDLSSAKFRTG